MTNPTALVSKLWNYCSVLRDDGLSYGEYVEQLTVGSGAPHLRAVPCAMRSLSRSPPGGSALLFLKVADEQTKAPYLRKDKRRDAASPIPKGKDWPSLLAKNGDELELHYRHTLEELGKCSGAAASPPSAQRVWDFTP